MSTPWLIGNDVVDLRAAEAVGAACRGRFVARVCTAAEREAVASAANPDRELWALWAAKEAAFKAIRKADHGIRFIPRNFEVEFPRTRTAQSPGLVRHGSRLLACSLCATDDYVHAICRCPAEGASAQARGELYSAVRKLPADPVAAPEGADAGHRPESAAARRLLEELALRHAGLRGRVIREDDLPPRLVCDSEDQVIDISLSHDGRYAAAALCRFERMRAGTPVPEAL